MKHTCLGVAFVGAILASAPLAGAAVSRDALSIEVRQTRTVLEGMDRKMGEMVTHVSRVAEPKPFTGFEMVMAALTVLYIAGTLGLWWMAKRQVKIAADQLESMRQSFYGATWQGIVANHREMYSKVLGEGNADLLDMMFLKSDEKLPRKLSNRERIMATMVINHAEACFLHLHFRMLPDEVRIPITRGLRALFRNPAVKEVWKSVSPEYRVPDFVHFVNSELVEERAELEGVTHK